MSEAGVPRLESLRVRNYRALRDFQIRDMSPFTVLIGRNGSGKSTVFDVFAFLAECFENGLRRALDRRGGLAELRARGQGGGVGLELKYREPGYPLITYELTVDDGPTGPFVASEVLKWRRGSHGRPFQFLNFASGSGEVVSGEQPDEDDERVHETLDSPDMLAANALGQLARHPRVSALRRFITGWYLSYVTADGGRSTPEAGPQERLSRTGDNLANVIQHLQERHPDRLKRIFDVLRYRVPRLSDVSAAPMPDGRLLLSFHDAPFSKPVQARFVSDGTMKMLAYLTVLYDPKPPQLVCIEEPENHLHPAVLPELAEECREAAGHSQVLVTTHSPSFLTGLRASEVHVLARAEDGFTQAACAASILGVREMIAAGASLSDLWTEGYLEPAQAPGR